MYDENDITKEKNINPLSAKLTKWPNTLKQFAGNLPTNCLSVFGHFVGFTFKGLMYPVWISIFKIWDTFLELK